MRNPFITCAIIILISASTIADIAPTQFVGFNIVPIDISDIRMENAKVDIVWGTPCQMTAVFLLNNESLDPIKIKLSFPIIISFSENEYRDFKIFFDDIPFESNMVKKVTSSDITGWKKPNCWYYFDHIFKPGRTKVTIKVDLPASIVQAWPYQENLNYIIHTGSHWKGPIGYEEVNIIFPDPLLKDQITEITPSNYVINNKIVKWQFKNIDPNEKHNISIQYIRPDVIKTLSDVRERSIQNPEDTKARLVLAKHLFALGPHKGYSCYPPDNLTKNQYQSILNKIKSKKKRNFFKSKYSLNDDNLYIEKNSEWNEDRKYLVRILNEIDYEPIDNKSPHVDEGRDIIEDILKKEPHNAQAWNIYLANYYRFRFAGINASSPATIEFEHQVNLIKQAYSNCPKDPYIALWNNRCNSDADIELVETDSIEVPLFEVVSRIFRTFINRFFIWSYFLAPSPMGLAKIIGLTRQPSTLLSAPAADPYSYTFSCPSASRRYA